jgi:hypothetical protein
MVQRVPRIVNFHCQLSITLQHVITTLSGYEIALGQRLPRVGRKADQPLG